MATNIPRNTSKAKKSPIRLSYDEKNNNFSKNSIKACILEPIFKSCQPSIGRLIWAENLQALSALTEDTSVNGKVQSIYIDPPYSTGGVFEDRSQNHAYSDQRAGQTYLEFMRQRIILLRELMAKNGSIFVHLDENYAFEMKILMDEVFGRDKFRNFIVRKKCNSKNYTKKRLGNVVDYILFYTKSKDYIWNRPAEKYTEEFIEREYPYFDTERGLKYKRVPLHAPGVRNGESGRAWRGRMPPPGKHWQYRPSTLDELDAKGEIYWSRNGNPRRKVFLDESKGNPLQDVWMDLKDAHNQNISITGYPTEKNLHLVERIVKASSEPGGLVLDAFSGSGTTGEAAIRTGRSWLCIDNEESAINATVSRMINGRRLMGDFVKKDFQSLAYSGNLSHSAFDLYADVAGIGFRQINSLRKSIEDLLINSSANPTSVEFQQSSG